MYEHDDDELHAAAVYEHDDDELHAAAVYEYVDVGLLHHATGRVRRHASAVEVLAQHWSDDGQQHTLLFRDTGRGEHPRVTERCGWRCEHDCTTHEYEWDGHSGCAVTLLA